MFGPGQAGVKLKYSGNSKYRNTEWLNSLLIAINDWLASSDCKEYSREFVHFFECAPRLQ